MASLEKFVLDLLKEKLNEIMSQKIIDGKIPFESDFPQTVKRITKKGEKVKIKDNEYYLYSLNDNLIKPMNSYVYCSYCNGSGNELESKMKALRSSSAMTYNLFNNHSSVSLKNYPKNNISSGKYTVEFEKQMFTLDESKTTMPANLDTFLTCGDTVVACEMKMLEWFSTNNSILKSAYVTESCYDSVSQGKVFEVFRSFAAHLIDKDGQIVVDEEYKTYFKRYDCFQMFKHILACYNYCAKHKNIKKLTLVNCVWEIKNPDSIKGLPKSYKTICNEEHAEFKLFKDLSRKAKIVFADIGVDFHVEYIPYHEFAEKVVALTKEEINYLKRYNF